MITALNRYVFIPTVTSIKAFTSNLHIKYPYSLSYSLQSSLTSCRIHPVTSEQTVNDLFTHICSRFPLTYGHKVFSYFFPSFFLQNYLVFSLFIHFFPVNFAHEYTVLTSFSLLPLPTAASVSLLPYHSSNSWFLILYLLLLYLKLLVSPYSCQKIHMCLGLHT